jgi:hypothetical protein
MNMDAFGDVLFDEFEMMMHDIRKKSRQEHADILETSAVSATGAVRVPSQYPDISMAPPFLSAVDFDATTLQNAPAVQNPPVIAASVVKSREDTILSTPLPRPKRLSFSLILTEARTRKNQIVIAGNNRYGKGGKLKCEGCRRRRREVAPFRLRWDID